VIGFSSWDRILRLSQHPEYLSNVRVLARRLRRCLQQPPAVAEIETVQGVRLRVHPREAIGSALWRSGLFELTVSEAILRLLAPGDNAVDGGANLGYTTTLMALAVGRRGSVLAFEPHPENAGLLRHNLSLLPAEGATIRVDDSALGSEPGQAVLEEPPGFEGNRGTSRIGDPAARGTAVRVVTLDGSRPSTAIGLLKLDLEGGELDALRGARRHLAEGLIRCVLFEANSSQELSEIAGYLASFGYSTRSLGQTLLGPRLSAPGEGSQLPAWQSRNHVASRSPASLDDAFGRRGWLALRRRLPPSSPTRRGP
jgi:FkbM family methyltransferase